jgi:Ribosomal protein S19
LNFNLLDKKILIYNGKTFMTLNVFNKVIGYKMGEFCITRKKPPHTGKQKHTKKVSRAREKLVAERRKIIIRGKINKKK